jgi:transposase
MIPIPSGVRVWIATGHTDMRRGMRSLALTVQEILRRDPHAGDLYIFRGRRGDLVKILWHYGLGMSLYAKRLDRGKFIWPSASAGAVSISAAQMAYMLEGINWRNPQVSWLSEETTLPFGESHRVQSVIHCVAWMPTATLFRMTLPP